MSVTSALTRNNLEGNRNFNGQLTKYYDKILTFTETSNSSFQVSESDNVRLDVEPEEKIVQN